MTNQVELRFTGRLAPESKITARTLSHSLGHLQRAVDKIVIYETRGSIRKYSSLAANQYQLSDLIVMPFEEGSIKIPLINDAADYISSRLRGILEEPYRQAADNRTNDLASLPNQVENAINRALQRDPERDNQRHIIDHDELAEREYIKAAVLSDVNNLLSPLRSSSTGEDETITIRVKDDERTGIYEFNKQISKNFNQIVRAKRLGPEVVYTGILEGLEKSNYNGFPYSGKFLSSETNLEMKVWVHTEAAALALNPHNLSHIQFSFWGSPIMVYGSFDAMRGDIVFLDFVR